MTAQTTLTIGTRGRGMQELTREVEAIVHDSDIATGLCHVFIQHTSASLILCENADPSVREDLEMIMQRLAPDGDPAYRHDTEGPDDMAAHIRSILTGSSLTLPVADGRLLLGTWQGIYLWEHRYGGYSRRITVTVTGA